MTGVSRSIHQIEFLRKIRARPGRDLSVAAVIADTASSAARTHKKLGELIELWERLVPEDIASHTSLASLRGGVLHVIVDSSSTSFELDRLLRCGLTNQLRREYRGTLVRIKTRLGKRE